MIKHYYNEELEQWTGFTLEDGQQVTTVPDNWEEFPDDWDEHPEGYVFVNAEDSGFKFGAI